MICLPHPAGLISLSWGSSWRQWGTFPVKSQTSEPFFVQLLLKSFYKFCLPLSIKRQTLILKHLHISDIKVFFWLEVFLNQASPYLTVDFFFLFDNECVLIWQFQDNTARVFHVKKCVLTYLIPCVGHRESNSTKAERKATMARGWGEGRNGDQRPVGPGLLRGLMKMA